MDEQNIIINADCWEHIKTLKDNTIDHIITDPPYDIGFMNKGWDKNSIVSNPEFWKECLRVLKPGGYILAFSHSRTSHRQTAAIEDAGFEIRDTIMWIYGSGFPKSHNVSLGIDKKNGHGNRGRAIPTASSYQANDKEQKNKLTANKVDEYVAKSEAAKDWEGWGTALKPAYEPVVMARKPLEGTVADNVLKYGTGAINVDACRIDYNGEKPNLGGRANHGRGEGYGFKPMGEELEANTTGRFPANVIMDEEAGKILDEQSGTTKGTGKPYKRKAGIGAGIIGQYDGRKKMPTAKEDLETVRNIGDSGGASRFFYCPKVSKKERNAGCEELEDKNSASTEFRPNHMEKAEEGADGNPYGRWKKLKNNHPTVKPIKLMEYLIKLVSREGQTILDPFAGSGSTGLACKNLNRKYILIEKSEEYYEIIKARLA